MESDETTKSRPPNPRAAANIFSIATFSWTMGLFLKGNKRDLEVNDLYKTLDDHTSSTLGNRLEKYWLREQINAKKSKREPKLLWALVKMFGSRMMIYGIILAIVEIAMGLSIPSCISSLVGGVEDAKLIPAVALVVVNGADRAIKIHCHIGTQDVGMRMRISLGSLIYKKALKLSKTALGETTVGQVVNLLSNDVNRFDIAVIFLHYLWIGPLETIVVTYFLWLEIGLFPTLIGVFVLLIVIPFQWWLGKKTSALRFETAKKTDERVRLMNEIISGIQVIKMYTWEKPFAFLVERARKAEIKQITGTSRIRGIILSFMVFHTRLALFSSIVAYVLSGSYSITAQQVFVITSYFNILRTTMTIFFPQGIAQTAEALVSIKRLQKFLLYEENELYCKSPVAALNGLKPSFNANNKKIKGGRESKPAELEKLINSEENGEREPQDLEPDADVIKLVAATARWNEKSVEYSLSGITLNAKKGQLLAVIGPVGAGKSSLLYAILRELPLLEGTIKVRGIISYASQEPWLFAGSIRQNILFGLPMEKERYRQVINVCALKTDFKLFPNGDKTIVGERGASLSGGQRARINLARAVYKKADIYLFDDPLSAVDTHVGSHLFEDCISDYLKDKTVVLVTHQLQYLDKADHIVLLQQGKIIAEGSYQHLQETGLDYTKLLASEKKEEEKEAIENELASSKPLRGRKLSMQSVSSSVDDGRGEENVAAATADDYEEMATKGTIGFYVYRTYFSAGGHCCFVAGMFLTFILAQIFASGGDAWLTYWVNLEDNYYNCDNGVNSTRKCLIQQPVFDVDRNWCISIFTFISISTIVVTLIRSYTFVTLSMRASMNLHNYMFSGITRATMYFFNTNPSGRILNRFSKDMGSVDEILPSALIDCIQIGLQLLGIIIVVAFVNVWLLIPTCVVAIIFWFLRQFYVSTSRSIKRLEGITRSPVFSHLNASMQGITTIRAFGAQAILEKEFDNHQDLHSSAWYLFLASSRAFGFWLDMVCVVYIALVTFSFVLIVTSVSGGSVGLAITQAIGLTGMFQWGMRQSAEVENQMTSVERVVEYGKIESEANLESPPDKKPPASWPDKGKIVFGNVFLRYEPKGEPVLKNLNFTIQPEEKVGIVGRTGAGKSSLIGALFRLALNEGTIEIDDIDIATVGLHEVRSKISIIPQEPVLFSGTMRKNLDPFDEYADHVLWNALEQVELKEAVNDLEGGLNSKMSEGGTNFSVGQRQLICLARAIVRNNKILVLDEATANVDPQTDALIQKTIRQKFKNCTVLTIAHRLNTVMDSDKVLVMDAGTCVEFDHPYILLQNQNGVLNGMVEKTGRAMAEKLLDVAAKNYTVKMASYIPHIDEDVAGEDGGEKGV